MSVFRIDGLSVEMVPAITKWSYEDLGDAPELHRWRAYWAGGDFDSQVSGIELRAYPVLRVTPAAVWINADGCREATKQPWQDGAPAWDWVPFNPAWMRKRLCHNGSGSAWAKPTQDEAIRSLAVRLCRWTGHISRDFKRAQSAIAGLEKLRPDLPAFAQRAKANLHSASSESTPCAS
jgi:hypothetical protein